MRVYIPGLFLFLLAAPLAAQQAGLPSDSPASGGDTRATVTNAPAPVTGTGSGTTSSSAPVGLPSSLDAGSHAVVAPAAVSATASTNVISTTTAVPVAPAPAAVQPVAAPIAIPSQGEPAKE